MKPILFSIIRMDSMDSEEDVGLVPRCSLAGGKFSILGLTPLLALLLNGWQPSTHESILSSNFQKNYQIIISST